MTRRLLAMGSLGIVLAAPALATAQVEQGRLLGTIKDAQGGVLPGVTITATSPALIGQRTAVTEVDGRYLFTTLPSGTWRMNSKNTFVGFLMPRNNKKKPNRNLSASTSPDSVLAQDSKTWIKKLEYQRVETP